MAKTQTRRISQEEPTKKQEPGGGGKPMKNMKKGLNRGAWTAEEDAKLAQLIQIYGPRRWQSIAAKAGLNRCGKSCRLRWMNYLRPNIKRGNISDQEEDLILRLHNLLGNRWSLIAGRIPGRTDNEIKNYWNSHLSKKPHQGEEQIRRRNSAQKPDPKTESRTRVFGQEVEMSNENKKNARKTDKDNRSGDQEEEQTDMDFNVDDFFDFSNEKAKNLEWVNSLLQVDEKN